MSGSRVGFVLALAVASPVLGQQPAQGLRIATWNVENLSADEPAWRVRELGDDLVRLGADLVFLQEVESRAAARTLQRELAARGLSGYEVWSVENPRLAQEVVLLGKVRPAQFRAYDFQGMGDRLDRVVWADFSLPGGRLRCVAAHLKAGVQDGGDARRRNDQVRQVVRDLVRPALSAGTRVILLGDLNDIDPEVRYSNGRSPDPASRVFELLRDQAPELRNTDGDLPLRQRVSTTHGYMFDHVVADARLAGLVGVARPSRRDGRPPSDHFPLTYDLAPLHAVPLRQARSPEAEVPRRGTARDRFEATAPGTVLGAVAVRVVLGHARTEDLEVRLTHAGRSVVLLQAGDGGEGTLDRRFVTEALAGTPAAGAWELEVEDRDGGRGAGTLRSWALQAAVVPAAP